MYKVILLYLLIDVAWLVIQVHTSQHYNSCPLCLSICLATMLHVAATPCLHDCSKFGFLAADLAWHGMRPRYSCTHILVVTPVHTCSYNDKHISLLLAFLCSR